MAQALRGVRRIKEQQQSRRIRLRKEAAELDSGNTIAERRREEDGFRFSPELFEHRARVMEALEAEGFAWFSHYSSVDCLHDVYGIEVCGIHKHKHAKSILRILRRMYPDWKPG